MVVFFCSSRQSVEMRRHVLNFAGMLRELFNSGINSTSSWRRAGEHPVYWWPARARLTLCTLPRGVLSVPDYLKIYSLPNQKYIGNQVPFYLWHQWGKEHLVQMQVMHRKVIMEDCGWRRQRILKWRVWFYSQEKESKK